MAILCIGEMLIDFIGEGYGTIDKVKSFKKEAGGCVANVATVASKLGHKSYLLTTLGKDGFGDFLKNVLENENVDCKYVNQRSDTFTPLAFVSRDENGDRSFSFYFKGSSALKISTEDVNKVDLDEIEIIHFASIAIQDISKNSHKILLEKAKEKGILISFDVNLRFNLWENKQEYYETIKEFIKYVDILKISDNELEFVTGKGLIEEAVKDDFKYIKHVLYTKGGDGSEVFSNGIKVSTEIPRVNVIDTTGAGDAFAGSYLSKLLNLNKIDLDEEELRNLSQFATNYATLSTTKIGAISSYMSESEYEKELKNI
ncbi:carbohydrate kinase family protein [Pseudostreptobacillus hongkongensis]|uniref:carbohydrate kinase family protein n=1 Tax=Pseudostreptobacillus hongkongensis TaxID=1162717 RepID=UPI00082D7ED6|nr:carbohydrate kinase [Pseudostreptobacillus hongkongensis]